MRSGYGCIVLRKKIMRQNANAHPVMHLTVLLLAQGLSAVYLASCSAVMDESGEQGYGTGDTVTPLEINIKGSREEGLTADIFVYNDDRLQRLDSYQRISINEGTVPFAASQTGKKIIAAILNPSSDTYEWKDISSFPGLQEAESSLKRENAGRLLMSGYARYTAGKAGICKINMTPLAATVRLNSIRCDFSGEGYKDAVLENVKVYLTNVNTEARIMQQEGFIPKEISNLGGLVESDMSGFSYPEAVFREISVPVGRQTVYPDITLACYPNESIQETAGSPYTRLVIEGTVKGKTCYYPISVNREPFAAGTPEGIIRNRCYTYSLTIRSMGSSDPDTPVSPSDVTAVCSILPWHETDGTEVSF